MFESGGIKMQMCFFVDGSKYTVCKMLDEEAIAINLPRKPHTFWTRPPKNLDKQFFCLVGMKVHFSWETNIACRRQSQKCIDWGLGDGNGGGVHLPEAIQRRAASDNPSTDSLYHKVNNRPPPVSWFSVFFYNTSCIDQSPSVCFQPFCCLWRVKHAGYDLDFRSCYFLYRFTLKVKLFYLNIG